MSENSKTCQTGSVRAWRLYERGRNYNSALTPSQYSLVETNWDFFIGNQWRNLPQTPAMKNVPTPTFNILKRVASLFIASLTSSRVSVHVEPLPANAPSPASLSQDMGYGGMGYSGMGLPDMGTQGAAFGQPGIQNLPGQWSAEDRENIAKFANSEIENLLEKFKFDYRLREALVEGAVTGDYCAHFWFDPEARSYHGLPGLGEQRGEIRMELVDGIDVMFGNPNDPCVENQPYILLVGRDTVENLRAEAKRVRKNAALYRSAAGGESSAPDDIQEDNDTMDFPGVGGSTELESGDGETGKALYVLLYSKHETEETVQGINGPEKRKSVTVHVTKATKTAVIYEDVDTGLDLYPIAWGNWERQKNQYHGRSLITGMIPNQVFINKMFAIAMRNMQVTAFQKIVFNKDLIPFWDNDPSKPIGIRGLQPNPSSPPVPIPQVAAAIPATPMSGQLFDLIDKVMGYTKDCLGATDAQLGNVKPDNTSALMVLQTNAEVPLENIRAGLHEWTEDIGRILLDMMGTYYGLRGVVVERTMMDVSTNALGGILFGPDGGLMTQPVTKKMVEMFDFDVFKGLWLDLRVDVGADTYFSKIAMVQTLDNLRRDGVLSIAQYLERLPDNLIPKKDELIRDFREQGGMAGLAGGPVPGQASGNYAQGGPMDEAAAVMGLPNSMQANYGRMNNVAKRTALQMGARKLR